ncbi:MAG: PqqD family protein [Bacteroidaceae bacterium]|nr:PqqD family protein [Bacteroidaceae bacterium]
MKIKEGFELREMCGENIIVAKGVQNIDFNKIISLNETAAYLWKSIVGKEFTPESMAELLRMEYEVNEATALADAQELAKAWQDAGLCE